jgi:site-specific DNA-cytosine methylase
LVSGGPPCQGFSKQHRGAHNTTDKRNGLVRDPQAYQLCRANLMQYRMESAVRSVGN